MMPAYALRGISTTLGMQPSESQIFQECDMVPSEGEWTKREASGFGMKQMINK